MQGIEDQEVYVTSLRHRRSCMMIRLYTNQIDAGLTKDSNRQIVLMAMGASRFDGYTNAMP